MEQKKAIYIISFIGLIVIIGILPVFLPISIMNDSYENWNGRDLTENVTSDYLYYNDTYLNLSLPTNLTVFDLRGFDPVSNDEVREECLAALNVDESRVIETFHKVIEKLIRVTAVLSDEEKEDVKRYNDVAKRIQGLTSKGFALEDCVEEELKQARRRYEEIMAKYGEEIYE